MKKQWLLVCALLSLSTASYANWYQDIINAITKQAGITNGILSNELTLQQDMLRSQKDIQGLMNQLNNHVTGHSGYGTYQFNDYQSYGNSAKDWSGVVSMAGRGQGDGALGQMMSSIVRDFPADSNTYNRGVSDPRAQQYYAMKSQTVIAARAASELDYNKIQDQIAYQQMLMKQIENTKDLKAATDLSNRIQVEGNLINLEILRQSALVNQQQAITEQGSVMSALSNAKFLTKE
jgi:hypothetical protein